MGILGMVVALAAMQDADLSDLGKDEYWPVASLVETEEAPEPLRQETQEPQRPLDRDLLQRRKGEEIPAIGLTFRGQAWYVDPSGWLYITRGSRAGTATRMVEGRDNHLESGVATVLEGRFTFWGPHSVSVRAGSYDTTGTGTAAQDFIYHGRTFAAGRRVRTDLDMTIVDVEYLYTHRAASWLTLTGHLGVEYWRFSGNVHTVDSGPFTEGDRGFSSGFWLAGIDGVVDLHESVAARFLVVGGAEGKGRMFIEAEAGVQFRLGGGTSLHAGYRWHLIHFRQSTNESDLLYSGPTLGLQIDF